MRTTTTQQTTYSKVKIYLMQRPALRFLLGFMTGYILAAAIVALVSYVVTEVI